MQLVEPDEPEYLPTAHEVQSETPSVFERERTVFENLPAAHVEQAEAPSSEVFPDTQVKQAVAPVAATYVPASQSVHVAVIAFAVY